MAHFSSVLIILTFVLSSCTPDKKQSTTEQSTPSQASLLPEEQDSSEPREPTDDEIRTADYSLL